MKNPLSFIACYFLVFTLSGQQIESKSDAPALPKTVFGIKGGINVSTFSASVNSDAKSRVGMNLGFYIKSAMTYRFFFRPELYYSGQGQKDNYIIPTGGASFGSTTTSMHYINMPLLFEQGRKVSFQIGPQFGLLVKSSEKGTVSNHNVDDDLKDVMTKADFGIVLGMGISPGKFNFGVRYNIGITDIYIGDRDSSIDDYPNIANRVFHFYVATSF
jgi:hypothetical protein